VESEIANEAALLHATLVKALTPRMDELTARRALWRSFWEAHGEAADAMRRVALCISEDSPVDSGIA